MSKQPTENEIETHQLLAKAVEKTEYPLEFWLKLIEGLNEEEAISTLKKWNRYHFYARTDLLERYHEGLNHWYDSSIEEDDADARYDKYFALSDSEKIAYLLEAYYLTDLGDGLYAESSK